MGMTLRTQLHALAISVVALALPALGADKVRLTVKDVPLDSRMVRPADSPEWGVEKYEDGVSLRYGDDFGCRIERRPLPEKPNVSAPEYPFGCCTMFDCKNVAVNRYDNEQAVCTASRRYVAKSDQENGRIACTKNLCFIAYPNDPRNEYQLVCDGPQNTPENKTRLIAAKREETSKKVDAVQGRLQKVEGLTPEQQKAIEGALKAMESMTPEQRDAVLDVLESQPPPKQ